MRRYIGIDFSINSTAITIIDDEVYHFCFYTKEKNLIEKNNVFKNLNTIVTPIFFTHKFEKLDNYSDNEIQKIKRYNLIINSIITEIKPFINDDTYIGIEGFSFHSQGNSLLDIVTATTILKTRLYDMGLNIFIIPPKCVKKFIGNGNLNKIGVLEHFLNTDIPFIKKIEFNKFLKENIDLLFNGKIIKKPIDDIIDSFYVAFYMFSEKK